MTEPITRRSVLRLLGFGAAGAVTALAMPETLSAVAEALVEEPRRKLWTGMGAGPMWQQLENNAGARNRVTGEIKHYNEMMEEEYRTRWERAFDEKIKNMIGGGERYRDLSLIYPERDVRVGNKDLTFDPPNIRLYTDHGVTFNNDNGMFSLGMPIQIIGMRDIKTAKIIGINGDVMAVDLNLEAE